jgi:hypothetical protein
VTAALNLFHFLCLFDGCCACRPAMPLRAKRVGKYIPLIPRTRDAVYLRCTAALTLSQERASRRDKDVRTRPARISRPQVTDSSSFGGLQKPAAPKLRAPRLATRLVTLSRRIQPFNASFNASRALPASSGLSKAR